MELHKVLNCLEFRELKLVIFSTHTLQKIVSSICLKIGRCIRNIRVYPYQIRRESRQHVRPGNTKYVAPITMDIRQERTTRHRNAYVGHTAKFEGVKHSTEQRLEIHTSKMYTFC